MVARSNNEILMKKIATIEGEILERMRQSQINDELYKAMKASTPVNKDKVKEDMTKSSMAAAKNLYLPPGGTPLSTLGGPSAHSGGETKLVFNVGPFPTPTLYELEKSKQDS